MVLIAQILARGNVREVPSCFGSQEATNGIIGTTTARKCRSRSGYKSAVPNWKKPSMISTIPENFRRSGVHNLCFQIKRTEKEKMQSNSKKRKNGRGKTGVLAPIRKRGPRPA